MNWFYAKDGEKAGPVDEIALDGLLRDGAITPATLIWRSGMAGWQPYAATRPAGSPTQPAFLPVFARPGPGEALCSECHRVQPEDDVIAVDGFGVCARCKPTFLQKLREGMLIIRQLPFAGFRVRLGAAFIDLIIVGIACASLSAVIEATVPREVIRRIAFFMAVFYYLLAGAYGAFFNGCYGATPGKMICNLRVVRSDGAKITYGRAIGRHFAKWASRALLFGGYLLANFDLQRRALHDHICDTRVVYKN